MANGGTNSLLDVQQLWTKYFADHDNRNLRDRLVEHYLPWATKTAQGIAGRMPLADRENAVADAILRFSTRSVSRFSEHGDFKRWAKMCLKRSLVDSLRKERRTMDSLDTPVGGDDGPTLFEILPAATSPNCDFRFCEMAADLPHSQAIVVWLRYYRGLSIREITAEMRISHGAVKSRLNSALKSLRKSLSETKS